MSRPQEDVFPQVKRFACDRCHGQKLRCPRSSSGSEANEPCRRCQKAGVRCNISVTQKTGRPSKASKLQKSKESTPSIGSPASERLSDVGRSSSLLKDKRSSDVENEHEINKDQSHSLRNGNQHFSPSPPSSDTFMTFDGYCTPISRDEYSEFFDCNFDTASPDTMSSQEFTQSNYPTPSSISTSNQQHRDQSPPRQNLDLYSDHTFGSFFDNLPGNENILFSESSTTINDPTFTMFDGQMTPLETGALTSIQQPSATPESMVQCLNSSADIMLGIGDGATNFPLQLTPRKRQLDALEQPAIQMSGTGKSNEPSHSKTLSRLQLEIHDCSERVIQQARRATDANNSKHPDNQILYEALGILLSTSERFIEVTSCICNPVHAPQNSSLHSSSENEQSFFRCKSYASSPASLSDISQSSAAARPLDSTTFHLMLACHTRLLPAYDAILDSISQRLPNPDSLSGFGDAFSIGSFTVPNGTFLESLLHLQVISHQLHRLSTTLHGHLLASRPQQPIEDSGSGHMRWGLCKAKRTVPVSMGDFAMEEVEEREVALQAKITKISELARKSRML